MGFPPSPETFIVSPLDDGSDSPDPTRLVTDFWLGKGETFQGTRSLCELTYKGADKSTTPTSHLIEASCHWPTADMITDATPAAVVAGARLRERR